jgi:hypothetical protein
VKEAVKASFEGGATGISLSRNYSEARLENIAAVGDALRDLGITAGRATSRREVTAHADW